MKRTQRQFLTDILESMTYAQEFAEGKTLEDLEDDIRTQWALERAFTVIGEAIKRIDPDLKSRYPELPWREIAGMRDVLVHGYWVVRAEVILETIQVDIPRQKPLLERVLRELPPEEEPA